MRTFERRSLLVDWTKQDNVITRRVSMKSTAPTEGESKLASLAKDTVYSVPPQACARIQDSFATLVLTRQQQIITPMLTHRIYSFQTPAARVILFVVTLHHACRTRCAWPAVELELDTRLGRLRCADTGHWPGRSTVGSRGGVVEVLPFRVVGSLFA